MLTRAEKFYLALTLGFLATGWGIKTWRRASVKIGPLPDPATLSLDSSRVSDSLARAHDPGDSTRLIAVAPDPGLSADGPPVATSGAVKDRSTVPARAEHPPRASKTESAGKVDLNRAEAAELMRVKGIGEKTAAAILAYRHENGPFRNVRDLLQIKGIGEKKLEKLAPHLIL